MTETSFVLPLLLLLPSIFGQTWNSNIEKWAVSGLYKEEIPSPSTFYSTVAPLVYEFTIPKWNSSDFILASGGTNCSSPGWTESSTCPVRFYLPEVQSRFTEYLFDSQPLVNTLEFMNASPQMSDIQFECDILAKHFRDVYVDSEVLERYLAKLKKCSALGDMEFFRKVSNYKYNISEVYDKMRNGFFSEVWMKVHDGRIDAGLWSNALNSLHSLLFTNYYIESNRWKFALADCQAFRIPTSLLAPSLLTDSLQDLFANLDKNSNQLIPVISQADVGNYYSAEIADCTFTNETFVVRVLIPVIPNHQSYSLIELKSAKFLDSKNKHICQIQLPNSPYVLFDNMEKIAYETNCKPNELCHVLSVKSQGKISSCASAYLNKHYFNVVKYCQLTCEEISPYHLGSEGRLNSALVQQVESDKFIVTGSYGSVKNSSTVTIRCPGWADKSVKLFTVGAMEIRLPCPCRIYTSASASGIDPRSPCDESVNATAKVVQVTPLHWMSDLKMKEARANQGRKGDSEIVLRFTDADLKFQDAGTSSALEQNVSSESSTSTGTKMLLVLYFLVIVVMFVMIIFMAYRLKSMGVNMNPLKAMKGTEGISYANIDRNTDNDLLSNEELQ